MLVRLSGIVLAVLLLAPVGVGAQTVTVEGGASGYAVAATLDGTSVADGVSGGYLGASVEIPPATWLQPYFAANGFEEFGRLWQVGTNLRLSPERWIARPVARVGIAFAGGDGEFTGGVGVYVGRQAGGLFTADWGSDQGFTFGVAHFGFYYRF